MYAQTSGQFGFIEDRVIEAGPPASRLIYHVVRDAMAGPVFRPAFIPACFNKRFPENLSVIRFDLAKPSLPSAAIQLAGSQTTA
jgi:hypothetical protein